jgi:hypothetical protein
MGVIPFFFKHSWRLPWQYIVPGEEIANLAQTQIDEGAFGLEAVG